MKRYISILIIISSLLSLSGCGGIHTNYREIQQLMVVQTMGLDREKGSVRVSMAAAAEASGNGPPTDERHRRHGEHRHPPGL